MDTSDNSTDSNSETPNTTDWGSDSSASTSSSSDDSDSDDGQIGGALNIAEHVEIIPWFEQHVMRLRTTGSAFRVRFHNLGNIGDVHEFLMAAIQHLLDLAFDGAGPEDRVGVEIKYVFVFNGYYFYTYV